MTSLIALLASLGVPERFQKAAAYLGLAALACAFVGLWLANHDAKVRDKATSAQRETDLRKTIERTEQGNEARQQIEESLRRDDGRSDAVYAQCLRTARTPDRCQRFLPQR